MTRGTRCWTPVALSADLPAGGVMRSFVGGQDLAVWRSGSGAVRAWNNRCPHRGMRLSHGFVRGESLTCIYHGWQYGTDGTCRYIPAHPDLTPPATLCVSAFACADKGGLIWVSPSSEEGMPGVGTADAEPVRSLVVDGDRAMLTTAIEAAQFPVTEAWRPGQGRFALIADDDPLVVVEGRMDHAVRRLIAGLQSLPGDRTAVHLLTSPPATSALKRTLSRWLERFRWFIENPGAGTASWRPMISGGEV